MSTSTLNYTELDIDFNSDVQCGDVEHTGNAPVNHLTRHGECQYLICDWCMEQDLKLIAQCDDVTCQCGDDFVIAEWIEFIPI